jgi:diacylglycerol kinase family enzyme
MKQTLTLVLVIFCLSLSAQTKKKNLDDVYSGPLKEELANSNIQTSQSDHISNCLIHYHNERMQAFGLGITSAAFGAGAIYFEGNDNKQVFTVISGVFAIASVITYVNAERWIGPKKLKFSGNGIAYKF